MLCYMHVVVVFSSFIFRYVYLRFHFIRKRSSFRKERKDSPVIGGGSTTVEGPKKDGMSLDVVTGVLRSPGCGSEGAGSSAAKQVAAGIGLPPLSILDPVLLYKHVSKLNTLKWFAATAAADSVSRKGDGWWWWWWWWWWCCAGSVSRPSMIMVDDVLLIPVAAGPPATKQSTIAPSRRTKSLAASSPLVLFCVGVCLTTDALSDRYQRYYYYHSTNHVQRTQIYLLYSLCCALTATIILSLLLLN